MTLLLMQRDVEKHEKLDKLFCVQAEIRSMCFLNTSQKHYYQMLCMTVHRFSCSVWSYCNFCEPCCLTCSKKEICGMSYVRCCGECLVLIERRLEGIVINCINEDFIIVSSHWMLLLLW